MELVTKKEIKDRYAETKSPALKGLLEEMQACDQGKMDRARFDKADTILYCKTCQTKLTSNTDNKKEMLCSNCVSKLKAEGYKKLLEKKYEELTKALNKEAGKNTYKINKEEGVTRIIRSVHLDSNEEFKLTIKRETVYSSGWNSPNSHALRIYTSDRTLSADRLKKDFGSKNLAKGLHKRCEKLIKEKKNTDIFTKERKVKEDKEIEQMKKDFPEGIIIPQHYNKPVYIAIEIKGFTFKIHRTYGGYEIEGLSFQNSDHEYRTYDKFNAEDIRAALPALALLASKSTSYK